MTRGVKCSSCQHTEAVARMGIAELVPRPGSALLSEPLCGECVSLVCLAIGQEPLFEANKQEVGKRLIAMLEKFSESERSEIMEVVTRRFCRHCWSDMSASLNWCSCQADD